MAQDFIIRLNEETAKQIEKKIKGSHYQSVEEYVLDLINNALGRVGYYTDAEEKTLRQRLNSLGYE